MRDGDGLGLAVDREDDALRVIMPCTGELENQNQTGKDACPT